MGPICLLASGGGVGEARGRAAMRVFIENPDSLVTCRESIVFTCQLLPEGRLGDK